MTEAVAAHQGPTYFPAARGLVPRLLEPSHRFRIGAGYVLREGGKLGTISTGLMTERALAAADELASRGIKVSILHMPTTKPFDRKTVVDFAARLERIMTRENHVLVGGLGSLSPKRCSRPASSVRWTASASPTALSNAARCRSCRRNAA